MQGLKDLGFKLPVTPTGAFYVFTRCDYLDADDYRLALHILENAGMAVTPGRDFGSGGYGFLRFTYANNLQNIEEGLRRLGNYLVRFHGPK